MPPRKKSEIQGTKQGAAVKNTALAPRQRASGGTITQVVCGVCGSSHSGVAYFEWLNKQEVEKGYDINPPFGVIQEVGMGRGKNFTTVGRFGPEDDPEGYFPLVKGRLLNMVKVWVKKGWLTEAEVKKAIK